MENKSSWLCCVSLEEGVIPDGTQLELLDDKTILNNLELFLV